MNSFCYMLGERLVSSTYLTFFHTANTHSAIHQESQAFLVGLARNKFAMPSSSPSSLPSDLELCYSLHLDDITAHPRTYLHQAHQKGTKSRDAHLQGPFQRAESWPLNTTIQC